MPGQGSTQKHGRLIDFTHIMSLIIGFRYQKRLVIFVFADFNYTLNTSFQHLFDLLVSLCVIKITDFKKQKRCMYRNKFISATQIFGVFEVPIESIYKYNLCNKIRSSFNH